MSLGTAITIKRGYQARGTILGKFLSAACIGVLLGLFVTFVVVERGKGFGAIAAGPWTGWPRNGTSDTDPYTRAILAYSGEMSLSESEGMSFVTHGDSNGAEFDPACDYALLTASRRSRVSRDSSRRLPQDRGYDRLEGRGLERHGRGMHNAALEEIIEERRQQALAMIAKMREPR